MKYRPLGNTGLQVSAIGFGAMRLPTIEGGAVDETEAIRMIRYAIDNGVNYIDTAYPYHGGQSEVVVERALRDGYGDKVILATKMPIWMVTDPAQFDTYFNEQLEKLGVESVDVYLLHGVDRDGWTKAVELGYLEWTQRQVDAGRIKHPGFSFHGDIVTFKEIIDAFDWDVCQIQYNYMNEKLQAGTEGLEYAASKGVGVIIMEPLLGGKLADLPADVRAPLDAFVKRTDAEWAFQWLWNKPEVALALSGMSTMEQVVENIASAGRSGVGALSEDKLACVAQVRDAYAQRMPIPCTGCRYCMPCPNGVDIPRNLGLLNEAVAYGDWDGIRANYGRADEGTRAADCIQCGICEEHCPQSIPISQWMPYIDEVLGQGVTFDPEVAAQIG